MTFNKSKEEDYRTLVNEFKELDFADETLLNPFHIDFPKATFWSSYNKINPWELWHGNLNASIVFIGQDFSDKKYFIENFENDWTKERHSPTNNALSELFSILDYKIGLPGIKEEQALPLFFTNAVLGIKQTGMAGVIKKNWYSKTAKDYSRKLIDIIQPKHVIVMGKHAYNMICKAYDVIPNDNFSEVINNNGNYILNNEINLFVVAHCSSLGKRNRNFEQQKEDWKKMKILLQKI